MIDELEVITLTNGSGWWLLAERSDDDGPWRRLPVVVFALVATPQSAPFVVPQVVGADGRTIVEAPAGTLVHAEEWRRCECAVPGTSIVDRMFCTSCGSVVG